MYANYGRVEDFERLKNLSVNVTGKIAIMRYGKIFRGNKVMCKDQKARILSGVRPLQGFLGYVQKCTLMRFMNCMIDITRCPLTSILTKTHIILSSMKSYENDKKACFI